MEEIIKKITIGLFSFALPKIKNTKAVREFKKKWSKDNYSLKMTLMFHAGVDDAKSLLDLPEEVIKKMLEDQSIREEIYRWIIEGISDEEFSSENLFLDPYYESYPGEQDKLIPFFKLLLMKINESKEENWDPEFLNILYGIEGLKEEVRSGFDRLEKQQQSLALQAEMNVHSLFSDFFGSIGYEDLQELLDEGKVLTARKKAEERLNHARKSEERLELNAIIATSYINTGMGEVAIPYLYAARLECHDQSRKNRLDALIHLFKGELEKAHHCIKANIELDGYSTRNVELLLNAHIIQEDYEECLLILEKHKIEDLELYKARILLALHRFNEVSDMAEKKLKMTPESKEWLLLKADSLINSMEYSILNGIYVDPKEVEREAEPILEAVVSENEDFRQLKRVKALKAALHFRNKQFKAAAIFFYDVYTETSGIEKEIYFSHAVWSYYLSGDFEIAIDLLGVRLSQEQSDSHRNYAILLTRVYLSAGKPQEALEVLERHSKDDSVTRSIDYYMVKLETLFVLMKLKEIEALIENVEKNESTFIANIMKGTLSSLKHEWSASIQSLEPVLENAKGEINLEIKLTLIKAYMKRGRLADYEKVINLIPSVLHWLHHTQMVEDYIISLYKLDRYDEILHHYHNDFKNPSIFVRDIVATVYFDNKWYEKSKEMYQSLYHQTQDVKFLLRFASCLFQLGQTKECFDTLHLAEKKVQENASINDLNLLTHAYKNAELYEKALEYAYKTFKLGEDSPDVWRNYFSQFLFLSSLVSEEACEQEYVDAFHQVLSQFHEKFPEESYLFEQVKAIEDDGSISDEFILKLKELSEWQQEIEDLVDRHRVSPEMFRQLTQREPHLLWTHMVNHNDHHFWINQSGKIEEVEVGIKNTISSKKVLCDLFSLFTLNSLNLLDAIPLSFELFITQVQYEALFFEYEQLKLARSNGIKTVSYSDGKLLGNEATPEQIDNSLNIINELIDWINLNCNKVGYAWMNSQIVNDKDIIKSMENSLQLCKDHSFSMMVDSDIIRTYAKEEYNVNAFSVMDFINYCYIIKSVEPEAYLQAIGKLIIMGYRFITASSDVYLQFLRQSKFIISGETELLFDYLRGDAINVEYAFSIVVEVLIWLWSNDIDNKRVLTHQLCELILDKSSGRELLKTLPELEKQLCILTRVDSEALEEIITGKLNED